MLDLQGRTCFSLSSASTLIGDYLITYHKNTGMRKATRSLGWAVSLLLSYGLASGSAILSTTGSFTADDDVVFLNFSLVAPDVVTIQTWSFSGGTNITGLVIPPGGFAPVLSLFDASGPQNLITFDAGGVAPSGCGPRNIDPATGFCLDAYMNLNLGIGSYIVALTQFDNLPNGGTLSNGFLEQGSGNFTGGPFFLNAGAGSQRTANWAVDISTASTFSVTPEPATPLLVFAGLMAVALWKRKASNWSEFCLSRRTKPRSRRLQAAPLPRRSLDSPRPLRRPPGPASASNPVPERIRRSALGPWAKSWKTRARMW
jgi:hypothetical protein